MECVPLTSITSVLRTKAPAVGALLHVTDLLNALLDETTTMLLTVAVSKSSLRLVERVLSRVALGLTAPPPNRFHTEIALGEAIMAAVQHGRLDFVESIHRVHPEPLSTRLLRLAARNGDPRMLQWLLIHRSDGLCIPHPIGDAEIPAGYFNCCLRKVYHEALNHTHHHIIRYLFERGLIHRLEGAGDAAAEAGDLDMVQWVHAQNARRSFSSEALDNAARRGHKQIVEFLLANRSEKCTSSGLIAATYADNDDIVTLLRDADAVGEQDDAAATAVYAASVGRLDILQAYAKEEHERSHFEFAMYAAAEHGHRDVIAWLVTSLRLPFTAGAQSSAAVNGHLSILQWAHDYGLLDGWTVDVMNAAAVHGRLEIVKWLHEHRTEGCTSAAMNGAAANGHMHMVQWLHEHRSEGCTTEATNGAACSGRLDIVKWLHTNRIEGCTTDAMDEAAGNGHLHVVKWLQCHRTEGCTTRAMDGAARGGHMVIVQFLHDHRSEGCSWQAAVLATINQHNHIVTWLREQYPLVYDPARVAEVSDWHS